MGSLAKVLTFTLFLVIGDFAAAEAVAVVEPQKRSYSDGQLTSSNRMANCVEISTRSHENDGNLSRDPDLITLDFNECARESRIAFESVDHCIEVACVGEVKWRSTCKAWCGTLKKKT